MYPPDLGALEGIPVFAGVIPSSVDVADGSNPAPDPSWGHYAAVLKHPIESPADGCEHATGWPMLAAWYELESSYSFQSGRSLRVRGGIPLWDEPRPPLPFEGVGPLHALPYRPIWLGLFVDVAVYALFWASIAAGTRRLVSWKRRRRGLCPVCGYDRGGLVSGDARCPECGKVPALAVK